MKKRKKSLSRFNWIFLLVIIFLPLVYFGRRFYKYVSMQKEVSSVRKDILVLEAEIEVIKSRIREYRRGNLIEAKARDDLGMIKKGEKVYLIQRK